VSSWLISSVRTNSSVLHVGRKLFARKPNLWRRNWPSLRFDMHHFCSRSDFLKFRQSDQNSILRWRGKDNYGSRSCSTGSFKEREEASNGFWKFFTYELYCRIACSSGVSLVRLSVKFPFLLMQLFKVSHSGSTVTNTLFT
jgi:hypothetical protein